MDDPNRCWCCHDLMRADGYCYLCDSPDGAVMVSPPHACLKSFRVISDEHGCDPEFTPLEVE